MKEKFEKLVERLDKIHSWNEYYDLKNTAKDLATELLKQDSSVVSVDRTKQGFGFKFSLYANKFYYGHKLSKLMEKCVLISFDEYLKIEPVFFVEQLTELLITYIPENEE